jgi:hypothetical protein
MKIIMGAWTEEAACKGKTDLFFPEQGDSKSFREAVAICSTCPVREPCTQHIMENDERFGIWAGTNAVRRRIMRNPNSKAQWTQCGTAKRYNYGCRCDDCRTAFTTYQRELDRRRTLREQTVTPGEDTDVTFEEWETQ